MTRNVTLTRMHVERVRREITQQALADDLGVTQPRISAWERLLTPIPKARRARIAQLLGLEPHQLDEEITL